MPAVIGQFNDSFSPIADGVCNVVKNYARWLNEKQYGKCYVVVPGFPGYSDSEAYEVLRYRSVPMPLRYPYRAGLAFSDYRFQKQIRNIKFDIIHVHSPFSSGRLGLRIARRLGVPIIATFHSKYYEDFKSALKSSAAARMLLKCVMDFYCKVDHVWTVSRSAVETMREYGFKGNVEVVGNGTDLICSETDCRGNGRLNLIYVGQLVWHKNLKLLVCALKLLKDAGVSFSMTVAGEGNAGQGIKRLVQRMGMNEEFIFEGRVDDREKLASMYSQADLNLLPSIYDTFSIVVREAAALGCPSLVINGSCAAEEITDGRNGYLSENDAQSFAGAIFKAASDSCALKAVGRSAKDTLYRSWESVVDDVALKYSDIIGSYKKARLYS